MKNIHSFLQKSPFGIAGVLALFLLATILLMAKQSPSSQAEAPLVPTVRFAGEYRIDSGEWRPISYEEHIPSNRGDITLRGTFLLVAPDGEELGPAEKNTMIAFFMDHIGVTVYEHGREPHVMDNENPMFGDSACGEAWEVYTLSGDGATPLEIVIRNPHRYGNETAVDSFLSQFSIWINGYFEQEMLIHGEAQRNAGLLFIIVSLVLLGTAFFLFLLHMKNNKLVFMLSLVIFFAGVYFVYSAESVYFWNDSVFANTTTLGCCMMFYMLMACGILVFLLGTCQKIGRLVTTLLGIVDAVCLLIPIVSDFRFYDTWLYWVIFQNLAGIVLIVCAGRENFSCGRSQQWLLLGAALPSLAFLTDSIVTAFGVWQGGIISRYVFTVLFVVSLVIVLLHIPKSINAMMKTKELEAEKSALDAELAKSRISTMISQIRPHFIYNTLGSIEQLCELDPPKAGELVHHFAKYLRGNFGELDNPNPIRMSQEMDHVQYYISIENVRFPDMTFTFDMQSGDFSIPALTIQPIVENAIKHGLMPLEKGGSIHVISYETDTHYIVTIEDDGVGFDTKNLLDERKHVGLRNIRGRLAAMVGGTLDIESTIGVGTKVTVQIPKEGNK